MELRHYRFRRGSSLPMIGDWDTGRQPAVALREPMAQRGERKSMWEAWLCGSVFRRDPCLIEDGGSGRKPLLQKPSFCRSGFSRDHCVIEDGGLGLKSLFTKHGTLPRLNRSCDEREEVASTPLRSFRDTSRDFSFRP